VRKNQSPEASGEEGRGENKAGVEETKKKKEKKRKKKKTRRKKRGKGTKKCSKLRKK